MSIESEKWMQEIPLNLHTVVSHFAALDASYCFLSKKHVKASLKHMYSLAKGILMNSRGETFSDDVFNMIIRIAPNTVLIRVLPFEKKSLELEFREYMQDRDRKKEKDNVPNPVQNKGTGVNPLFVIDSQSEKFSNILDQHELVLVPTGHTKKKIEERRSHFMKALKSLLDAFPTITRVSDLISHFRSDSIPIETSIEGAQSARPERISVTIGETTEATTGRRNDFANRLHSAHHSTIEALASAMVAGTSTIEYLGTDRGQSSVRGLVVYARETYEVHSPPGLPFPLSLVGTASWSPPVAASSPEPTPTSPDSSPKSPHSYISPTCALGDFPPAIPCINDTVESFLQAMPFFKDQVSDVISYEGRPPQFSELRTGMPDELKSALGTVGIRKFYRHQQMAIDHLMESSDHHVMISTSTSSGKSLCFLVPIMLNIINDPSSTSLLIFPTKALAQDQLRSITDMTKASTALSELIRPVIFDGDTSHAIRDTILQSKRNGTKGFVPPYNVILTNPDIMHATMLPLHKKWSHILRTMKIVVLDEAHVYRGVFGSHVALVLRRFRRLCAMYNNYPQFVACSATISNPLQLFRLLVPPLQARKRFEPFEAMPHVRNVITVSENQSRDREDDSRTILLIDSEIDGSMVGAKKLVIWNPSTLLGNNPIEHYTAAELKYSENMPGEINSKGKDPKERILNSSPVLATQTAAPTPSSPQTRRSSADDDTIDLTTPTQTPDRKPHATPESSRSSNPEARSLGTESQGADRRVPPPTHPSMPVAVHIRPPWGKLVGVLRARRVQLRAALEEANLHGAARSAPVDTLRLSQGVEEENEIEVSEAVKKLPAWAKRWIGSFGKDIYQRDSEFPQRASTLSDSAKLIVALTLAGLRTIVFVKSRRVAELVLQFVQERLSIADSAYIQYFLRTRGAQYQLTPEEEQVRPYAYINKIRGYRAGYLKENRRQLEREMFSGTLSTIIATNALELGIDIGSLDCSLLVGYPNSVSSLWQQSGRAGRGGRNNLTIVVAYDSPVDQLLVRNTRQLLGKGVEAAVSDPQNPKILKLHILSAAKELVLSPWDVQLFGDAMGTIVSHLRRLNMIVPVAKITSFDGYIDVVGSTITPTTGRRNLFEEIPRERLDFDELWLQYESVERRHEMLGESIHNELVNVTPASPGKGIVIDYKDSLNPSRGTSVSSTREERLLFDDEDELEDLSIGSQDFGGLSFSQIVSSQFVPRSNTEPKSPLNRGHRAKAAIGSGGSDSASDATSIFLAFGLGPFIKPPTFALRSIDEESFTVVPISNPNVPIDHLETWRAYWEMYPGAVYLNQGKTYVVTELDTKDMVIYVKPTNVNYFTVINGSKDVNPTRRFAKILIMDEEYRFPISFEEITSSNQETETKPEVNYSAVKQEHPIAPSTDSVASLVVSRKRQRKEALAPPLFQEPDQIASASQDDSKGRLNYCVTGFVYYGRINICRSAWAYSKVAKITGRMIEKVPIPVPELAYDTYGLWFDLPYDVKLRLDALSLDYLGGVHACNHAVKSAITLHVLCDTKDLACECPSPEQTRERPFRIVVYDEVPGGSGICRAALPLSKPVFRDALQLLLSCPCEEGCSSCCHDYTCAELNIVIDKKAAVFILQYILHYKDIIC